MISLIIAALLAGHPDLSHAAGFPVRCEPLTVYGGRGDAEGIALLEERAIVLSPETCRGFSQGPNDRLDSLVTLGHERAHLQGVTDEHEADCAGLLDVPRLARRLQLVVKPAWIWRYVKRSPDRRCY